MIFLLQLLVLGVIGLLAVNLWKAFMSGERSLSDRKASSGPIIEGRVEEVAGGGDSPGRAAAETLKAFENAREAARATYPSLFAMLGGYLNAHAIERAGDIEAAVRTMIEEWSGRRAEITEELTRLLADNKDEAEVRAIVVAACDAEFELEGYRKWLIWLLGRFNAL
ncbi:MAG: hypothetical protein GC152_04620 [Alphaproteobacteria bacterium]|nr:hypothetical protein [Alphaproteobacteria bacterium]